MTRKALVLGAGRGVGRATAIALAGKGHKVVAVARTQADLDRLAQEVPDIAVETMDASEDGAIAELLQSHAPDVVLHIGGTQPKMGLLSENDWESFSAPWQNDTKTSFDLAKAALGGAMPAGSAVITFASGAAINGSPMSGGYAGAKRTQHFVMNYAQAEADKRELGLTFTTIYPKQLIAGTHIAADASAIYGKMSGKDAASFMSQWDAPLTPDKAAQHVLSLVADPAKGAFAIDGAGMVALP